MTTLPARIGFGAQLQVETNTPGVFETIASLSEIGELGGDVDDIDITTHDTQFPVREYTRGLAEPGEIAFTGVWVAEQTQFDLFDKVFAGLIPNENYQLVLPDNMGVAQFAGYVGGFKLNPQMADRIEFSGRIKMSGPWTFVLPS